MLELDPEPIIQALLVTELLEETGVDFDLEAVAPESPELDHNCSEETDDHSVLHETELFEDDLDFNPNIPLTEIPVTVLDRSQLSIEELFEEHVSPMYTWHRRKNCSKVHRFGSG